MGRLTLRRSAQPSDAGFTLIEAVASLAIATLILTGLAFATVGSLRGSATARINQQAGDVLESAIEAARDQAYDDLVMYTGDPNLSHTADSRILQSGCPSGGSMCVSVPNPTGSGSTTENIVTSTAIGFQSNHIQTQTSGTNKVPFTIATYVTKPADDSSASYKRVTVFVSWTNYGKTHTREGSSYVAETQRGLPLPKFTLTCAISCSQASLPNLPYNGEFEFTLTNSGARDSFDFKQTGTTLTWTYYLADSAGDTPQSGLLTQLTDSSGDGIPDTGLIDTDGSVSVWAVASNVPVGSYAPTFSAVSDAQPNLSTGTQSQAATLVVATTNPSPSTSTSASTSTSPSTSPSTSTSASTSTSPSTSTSSTSGNCSGIKGDSGTSLSGVQYYLHNTSSSDGASVAQYPMSINTSTVSTTTNMPNYSNTDGKGTQIGRNLSASTPSITASTAASVASFQVTVTSNKNPPTVSGKVILDLWAEVDPVNPPSNNKVQLQAMVGYKANGNGQAFVDESAGGEQVTAAGCGSWEEFRIAITIPTSFATKNGGTLEVSVFNIGASDVRLGYGSNTATTPYPSDVWFTGLNPTSFNA